MLKRILRSFRQIQILVFWSGESLLKKDLLDLKSEESKPRLAE